jgi:dinuclear metal center YbgI/SA1388 family protein
VASRSKIIKFLNTLLSIDDFPDESLNGLQVEGQEDITKVAVTVDASLTTVKEAASLGAKLLIVHHGLFWDKPKPIIGPNKEIFTSLFNANINLYAAHIPLDAHIDCGNNFLLARLLELDSLERCFTHNGKLIGCKGKNTKQKTLNEMKDLLASLPGASTSMTILPFAEPVPSFVGIISGSGANALTECKSYGIDTFITGEPRQAAYHYAKDNKLNAIFAGHYATETVGVMELGKQISKEFNVPWEFINCPTGI